jgi:hypothetical protein
MPVRHRACVDLGRRNLETAKSLQPEVFLQVPATRGPQRKALPGRSEMGQAPFLEQRRLL